MTRISSEVFVRALSASGFATYRSTAEATILERGTRAVTVPTCAVLDAAVVMDLRRMAGLSLRELELALAATTSDRDETPRPPRPNDTSSGGVRAR